MILYDTMKSTTKHTMVSDRIEVHNKGKYREILLIKRLKMKLLYYIKNKKLNQILFFVQGQGRRLIVVMCGEK